MSVSVTLQKSMARSLDMVSSTTQHIVVIAGLLFLLGAAGFIFKAPEKKPDVKNVSPTASAVIAGTASADNLPGTSIKIPADINAKASPKPYFTGVLDYVKRRYRVSPEAVLPMLEVAEWIGQQRRIDPLLIVAIIGVESGFNPLAESPMGARGLMQVIPRFHMDKVPEGMGVRHLFDPAVNIWVGVQVLEEAIRRRGGLTPALQYYAGSSDPMGGYANRVLAEKARLEKAARRTAEASASVTESESST